MFWFLLGLTLGWFIRNNYKVLFKKLMRYNKNLQQKEKEK